MEFIELRSFDNYIEANIVLQMLQEHDVNCHLKDEHIVTIDPLLSPAVGGIKLMIHHSHMEKAWELINTAEQQYLKSIPCPVCKKHTLVTVAVTREYRCRLSALASMLLNGRTVELKKVYQCTSCGYDFDKL